MSELAEAASRLRGALAKGVPILLALSVVPVFLLLYRQQLYSGLNRTEYEGKVIDKSLTLRETKMGSKASPRLLIEGAGGERFEVRPDEDVYERVQVGMWIKSSRGAVELSWSRPETTPAERKRD